MSQINFQISFPKFFSHQILNKKYATTKTLNQINTHHIIFNEKCRIVSKFKDFLILDDATEFLKAFYKKPQTILKLKQIFLFYETYRKIFPNYIAIFPENKHLYRNDLIQLGNWGRKKDPDYWLYKLLDEKSDIIVTDIRVEHEIELFKSKGAFLLRVEAS
jgi:hypothetical protein